MLPKDFPKVLSREAAGKKKKKKKSLFMLFPSQTGELIQTQLISYRCVCK